MVMTAHLSNINEASLAIGELLKDPVFLSHVSQHLVDADIGDCRLVSSEWRQVCSELPVKVKLYPVEESLKTVREFPRATSVTMMPHHDFIFWTDPKCEPTDIYTYLKSLPNLRSLVAGDIMDDGYLECLQSLTTLRSLDLSLCRSIRRKLKAILVDSGHCLRLTSLSLLAATQSTLEGGVESHFDDVLLCELFSKTSETVMGQLKCLRLNVTNWSVLVPIKSSPLLHPLYVHTSFPNLTDLSMSVHNWDFSVSLPDLHLCIQLESVSFFQMNIRDHDLFRSLTQLPRLKSICLMSVVIAIQTMPFESLAVLDRLESLVIGCIKIGNNYERLPPPCLSDFNHLTKLHIYSSEFAESLSALPNLRDLHVIAHGHDAIVYEHIPHLTNLEVLHLEATEPIRSSVLAPLKKLQRVELIVETEDGVMDVLANLKGLTSVRFLGHHGGCDTSF